MYLSTAGTTFYIGSERPSWRAQRIGASSAFNGETWTAVTGLTSLGRLSGQWQTQDHIIPDCDDIDEAPIPNYDKFARPAATMEVIAAMNTADAGQIAMLAAEDSLNPFAFRVEFPDGSARMFVALVVSAEQVMEEANNVVAFAISLIVQSNVVRA